MKANIKYFLNVFGLMFIVIGLTCNLSNTWEAVFCVVGSLMYMFERQIKTLDRENQNSLIKINED
jgi:hypothetical protein